MTKEQVKEFLPLINAYAEGFLITKDCRYFDGANVVNVIIQFFIGTND